MTVHDLLTRCPSAELSEWMAVLKIENSERQMAAQRSERGFG